MGFPFFNSRYNYIIRTKRGTWEVQSNVLNLNYSRMEKERKFDEHRIFFSENKNGGEWMVSAGNKKYE